MPTIQEQMAANSAAWHTAKTQAEKDALHQANVNLASQLGTGAKFNSGTGKWSGVDSGNGGTQTTQSTGGGGTGGGINYGTTDYSTAIKNTIDQAELNGTDATAAVQALLDARNEKIAGNSALAQYANDQYTQMAQDYINKHTVQQPEIMSFNDFLAQSGYSNYENEVQSAIAAQVQAAVDAYNQQITDTETSYQDNARQAYIAKMLGQKNLDQTLAANGYAGGMADSQRIATETNYQNQLTSLQTARDQTIAEIKAAITQAQLAGDQQMAELLSSYLTQIEGYYQDYAASQEAYNQEKEATNTNYYRTIAESILASGQMPTDDILTLAGIDKATAQSILGTVAAAAETTETPAAEKVSYNNGGLTQSEVAAVQSLYGLDADGYWGPNSQKQTGYASAAEAKAAYTQNASTPSFSDIKRTLQQFAAAGNDSKILTIANQYSGTFTNAQKLELQKMLKQYGYDITF